MSTQLAPQRYCPALHALEHVLVAPLHAGVEAGHTLPHAPQFCESKRKSTHTPLQTVEPVGHWHRPSTHEVPAEQTLPHAPQLLLSMLASTQRPAQSV